MAGNLIDKIDALIGRHRRAAEPAAEAPVPVLTVVVDEHEHDAIITPAAHAGAAQPPAAEPIPQDLARLLAADIAQQLLAQIDGQLKVALRARLAAQLDTIVDAAAAGVMSDVNANFAAIVRDALGAALRNRANAAPPAPDN